jgi:cell division protein FtsI/penicillin-binding protein 2
MPPKFDDTSHHLFRIRLWYGVIVAIVAIFLVRLFYLQVIRHDYYKTSALTGQFKEYEVAPKRGVIEAQNGNGTVPIVLNEVKYTLFADPVYVKDKKDTAVKLQQIIGGKTEDIEAALAVDTRYTVLAKKLDKSKKQAVEKLDIKGVGLREQSYRTYPQGTMAASLLGFVNDDGEGKYGIEQYLDKELRGQPGQLKAITDAQGVPLVSNQDNVIKDAKDGNRVVLTIDMSMQQQLEEILKKGLKNANSKSGGVFVMEAKTGAIKAMANYPTYNPGEFYKVEDAAVFNNTNVSAPYEIGSVMKPLTMAAALDKGVINANSSFYDKGFFKIDDATVSNVEEAGGAGQRSMADILRLSLNTGATWLLMQMGGGSINEQARTTWHDYMVNRYRFSKTTNIEQGYEGEGIVPDPNKGYGLDIQYANTSFGQGMTATPVQTGAALASVLNGGTYYRPRLVSEVIMADGTEEKKEPEVVARGIVSQAAGKTVQDFMVNVMNNNHTVYGFKLRPNYLVGAKTGTAQIPKPGGGYYDDRYNGSFTGFIGGDEVKYVVVVRVNEPKVVGYAGSKAAGPIFAATADMLIDNFNVLPKSN